MAPHSSTLAWKISWTEEHGRLQSMGSRRVRHDWATSLSLFTFMHWRRKWQPTPVFLPGESQGQEPGGLPSMGSHRVGHDWSDLAAAAVRCSKHPFSVSSSLDLHCFGQCFCLFYGLNFRCLLFSVIIELLLLLFIIFVALDNSKKRSTDFVLYFQKTEI